METVGMHKRQRDSMERFQHSLETINRRFHRVLSALCAMAPELITRPNFMGTHLKIANNPDFYPFFKDYGWKIGAAMGPSSGPKSISSRKDRLAKNILAICDFDMNFTYVYAGWEGNTADARVLDHAISQDPTFSFLSIGEYYNIYID
ncbi:UNVERIFIED_CONTAM: hypothetical protein Sradi_2348300 [Sesamum radiatum]|uniref:DUF8040 domain-containing protein n=1 Tax=Sesamum radiatum TaxID=300843 RepID=A0AAW2T6M5_SESRA